MWGALSDEKSGTFQFLLGISSAAFLRSESLSLLSLFLRLLQPRGPGSCIYIPQEQGSPIIPSGIGLMVYMVRVCCSDVRFVVFLGRSLARGVPRCEDRPCVCVCVCVCRIRTQGRSTNPRNYRGIMATCPITASCGPHK
jgi:hypothetical protein